MIFRSRFQMMPHILVAVLIAALLFVGYLYFSKKGVSYTAPMVLEDFEVPAPAPVITQPLPEPPRTISSGGPTTPNQAPPRNEPPVRLPGPEPNDSEFFEESYGSSDLQDNMRYPERLFGPAPLPDKTDIAVESGVAGSVNQVVSQAIQTFSPDFAQNGGEFIRGGIFANDTFEVPNYSAI